MEEALNKFLNEYKDEEYFLGAILTGSYVTGNNTPNSDIDVYIISKDDTPWRERGNKLIDGYLIEYFINPKWKIMDYMNNERKELSMSTTNIFINSKILYDKDGSVQELIDYANNSRNTIDLIEIDDFKYKSNCYSVWDSFDELEDKYKSHKDIDFSYYIYLERVIKGYFYNKKIPALPLNKLESILMNEEYYKKYNISKMPNQEFISLLTDCFIEKNYDKKFINAKKLYDYFMSEFNDFNINDFSLRSDAK